MNTGILGKLYAAGQSVWLDTISRDLIESGQLEEAVSKGLRGLTSNPTILDIAIRQGTGYDQSIRELARQGASAFVVYETLTIQDVQAAADIFLPVYKQSRAADGYVSVEINPRLSYDVEATVAEGRRLWKEINRPNLMLKVPSTDAGYAASERLLAEGKNVNATLIFSRAQYERAAQAYLAGLRRYAAQGGDLRTIRSVASVSISRLDAEVDALLDRCCREYPKKRDVAAALKGTGAVANACAVYNVYEEYFNGAAFSTLRSAGAMPQPVLWTSTGNGNPDYSELKYVQELLIPQTVNTVPEKTLQAVLNQEHIEPTIDRSEIKARLRALAECGIDLDALCVRLMTEALTESERSFKSLLDTIEQKIIIKPVFL